MADFKTAFEKTMKNEGGYSKDPRDKGGETYKGISRNHNPTWVGWEIIDHAKETGRSFPDTLFISEDYRDLNDKMIPAFYKSKYWDVFLGDEIEAQIIANELFDTGVNMGTQRAVLFLQRSLNLLGLKRGILSTDQLIEDGIFGTKTFNALHGIKPKHISDLYKLMNVMQAYHYIRQIKSDFRQADFLIGWLERIEVRKT